MGTIIIIAIIIFVVCLYLLCRKISRHREPWDDIKNVEMQEDLNESRIEYGLKPKKINYEKGNIVK